MMVCCETLQIFAASPVVNTVFIRASTWPAQPARKGRSARGRMTEPGGGPKSVRDSRRPSGYVGRREALGRPGGRRRTGKAVEIPAVKRFRVTVQDGELRQPHSII